MKKLFLIGVLLLCIPAFAMAQNPGDWVLGNWKGGGYWFPGVVQSTSGNKVTIVYDDGTRETVSSKQVRPYSWKLGTRVQCRWSGGAEWYAGEITGISKDGTKLDIKYDDGDRERIATGGCRSK